MTIQEIINSKESFKYQLLSRMQQDCKYYLGNGGRNTKQLWASNEKEHIEYMKSIWASFPQEGKPEWLSMEEIEEFEKAMVA